MAAFDDPGADPTTQDPADNTMPAGDTGSGTGGDCSSQQAQVDQLTTENQTLTSQVSDLSNQVQGLQAQVEQAQQEVQAEQQAHQQDAQQAQQNEQQLQTQLDQAQQALQQAQQGGQTDQGDLQGRLSSAESQIADLQNQLAQAQQGTQTAPATPPAPTPPDLANVPVAPTPPSDGGQTVAPNPNAFVAPDAISDSGTVQSGGLAGQVQGGPDKQPPPGPSAFSSTIGSPEQVSALYSGAPSQDAQGAINQVQTTGGATDQNGNTTYNFGDGRGVVVDQNGLYHFIGMQNVSAADLKAFTDSVHNLESLRETSRANQATESENVRSHQATEAQAAANLASNERTAAANRQSTLDAGRATEANRHMTDVQTAAQKANDDKAARDLQASRDQAAQAFQNAQLAETHQHNQSGDQFNRDKLTQDYASASADRAIRQQLADIEAQKLNQNQGFTAPVRSRFRR